MKNSCTRPYTRPYTRLCTTLCTAAAIVLVTGRGALAEPLSRAVLDARGAEISALVVAGKFDDAERQLQALMSPGGPRTRIGDSGLFTVVGAMFEPSALPFRSAVEAWVKARPHSAVAAAVYAEWLHDWAWEARGTRYTSDVPGEAAKLYQERLARAKVELDRASQLDAANLLVTYRQLTMAKELGASTATRRERFERANGAWPNSWAIHVGYVEALAPKWSGEDEAVMQAEVARLVAAAPPSSAIVGLPIVAQDLVCAGHGGKKAYLLQAAVWQERERAYRSLLERFPNAGYFAASYASDAFLTGRTEVGVAMLQKAIAAEPDNPETIKTQRKYGHLITDPSSLGGSPKVTRDEVTVVLDQAGKAYRAKQYPEAEKLYRRATELHPTRSNSWHMLGAMIAQQGRFRDAIAPYERAIELDPKRASYYTQLCYARMMSGNLQQGVEDCTRAISIDANEKYAYLNRARAFQMLGKNKEAEEDFRVARSLE